MHHRHLLALLGADRRRLVRAATRLVGPADAEDTVQDAYLRALQAGPAELEVAQAWLFTVVRHLAIDRLRRRHWMQQWLAQTDGGSGRGGFDPAMPSTTVSAEVAADVSADVSAETQAARAQKTAHALALLAAHLTPADGAAVLLHAVFEFGHADIARASGRSEAGSRQQLRRALALLRQAARTPGHRPRAGLQPRDEAVFHLYLRALQLRDAQALWALLAQPPVQALAGRSAAPAAAVIKTAAAAAASAAALAAAAAPAAAARPRAACGIVQVGAQLALVLTLDGVTLCVLPLGGASTCSAPARHAQEA